MIKYSINLQNILGSHLQKTHLSRQKFISGFILSMIKNKSVKFPEIADDLNDSSKPESNLRRIQNFFADYEMDYLANARLLMSFVPLNSLDVSIDRTNWKFGKTNINILCLTVGYKGVGVPILFELLDKKGNSNAGERIELLDKFIALFGAKCINSFTADREFIGDNWYKYLIINKIPFYIRLPKSHRLTLGGVNYRIDELVNAYVPKGEKHIHNIEMHGIYPLSIGLRKLPKNGKKRVEDDYLAVLTNCPNTNALQMYKKRWTIETFFQSIKERGFDIEQTHLDQAYRLKKLFAFVALAFALCLTVGVHHDQSVKLIEIKNNGYKQNSFFRVGLDKFKRALNHVFDDFDRLNNLLSMILKKIIKISLSRSLDKSFIT
jgi:Transposase DDE domain